MGSGTSAWQGTKLWLHGYVPVDRDLLHLLIGLALLAAALVAGRQHPGPRPFVVALALATVLGAGMEVLDRRDDIASLGGWRWRESATDLLATILFPALGTIGALLRQHRG